MSSRTARDFAGFCLAVHGYEPFPWQQALVEQVLQDGTWPDVIDVPTCLGKTTLIDISVFVAAATAQQAGADRAGRRRLFFVVDRRLVVDEAHQHALSAAAAFAAAEREPRTADPLVARVVSGLRSLAPHAEGEPLSVARMRGGTSWSANWLDRVDRPAVVVGTVDQVGSRLFFRGYGVSDRRKPLDAALVGTDSLIVVDEAHLADAFLQTLGDALGIDGHDLPLPRPHVLQLSATARAGAARRFVCDLGTHLRHPEAGRRLGAAKRLHLVEVADRKRVAHVLAGFTRLMVEERPAAGVLVVANTIRRARAVHALLTEETMKRRNELDADVWLLTGRSRPVDRDALVRRVMARLGVGRERRGRDRAAILVATQTVEVGANLDVDALITDSAPLDALVQRLGRLNRLGRLDGEAPALVVHDGEPDDPVYGAARAAAWRHLLGVVEPAGFSFPVLLPDPATGVDVSPRNIPDLLRGASADCFSDRPEVPLLLRPVLDAWARTAPVPAPDPPVAPYLHGIGTERPELSVVWRDDLPLDASPERRAELWSGRLRALPPVAEEAVDVPFAAARRWLLGLEPVDVADVGARREDETKTTRRPVSRPVAVTQDGDWAVVDATAVTPGTTVVVPTTYGGLDEFGWAPDAADSGASEVRDVAEVARRHRKAVLRLDRGTARRLWPGGGRSAEELDAALVEALRAVQDGEGAQDAVAAVFPVLATVVSDPELDPGMAPLVAEVAAGPVRVVVVDDGQLLLLASARRSDDPERDDDREAASSAGRAAVSLREHSAAVARRARVLAEALGLGENLADSVAAAAQWHDLGKAEPRFQAMLHGGDALLAKIAVEPLAKSGMDPSDSAAYRVARVRSRLPRGARHEAWSAQLARQLLAAASGLVDPDLVVHLVASHHGHGRPLLPPVVDPDPRRFSVSADGLNTFRE